MTKGTNVFFQRIELIDYVRNLSKIQRLQQGLWDMLLR